MTIHFSLNDCFFFGAIISATDPGKLAISFCHSLSLFPRLGVWNANLDDDFSEMKKIIRIYSTTSFISPLQRTGELMS